MSKATFGQKKFILDLGLKTEREVERMSKEEAVILLTREVPKYHARKLLEWRIKSKEELDIMLPKELRELYIFHSKDRKIRFLKERLNKYQKGEQVEVKQVMDRRDIWIPCHIRTIRYPKAQGSRIIQLDQNITVEFPDGKGKAVDIQQIRKNK